jgi:hypothetical protein
MAAITMGTIMAAPVGPCGLPIDEISTPLRTKKASSVTTSRSRANPTLHPRALTSGCDVRPGR